MRYYANAPATTLASGISGSATLVTVASITGLPVVYPFTLIFDPDTALEEVVSVTAGSGTSLTTVRGEDGTTGLEHDAGTVVVHGVSAREFSELQEHIAATTDFHGVTGTVVTTTATQTVSGKTLTTPTIASFVNATHDHTATAGGGNVPQSGVTGLEAALTAKAALTVTDALDTRLDSAETSVTDHGTRLGTAETSVAALVTATADTGWITAATGWTIAAGWTASVTSYRRVGDLVGVKWQAARTGATLTGGGSGNIGDTTIWSAIPADARPSMPQIGAFTQGGVTFGTFSLSGGVLQVETLHDGGVVASGDQVYGSMTFFV